jgi:hypothetical protein
MAKKDPETVDRFRVSCEVPKDQLGHIVAEMTKMGLEHVNYELITDVLNYKKPKKFDTNGTDHLRAWIKDHPTFNRQEVIAHFIETGRSEDSGSNAVYILAREKAIKKLGDGNYQRADIKAIAGPKKAKTAKVVKVIAPKKRGSQPGRKPNVTRIYAISNNDLLLTKFRERKKFTVREAEDYFEANKRPRKSVWPILHNLTNLHKLKRLTQGEYAVVKMKLKPRVHTPKLNGAAAPAPAPEVQTVEVVTNG